MTRMCQSGFVLGALLLLSACADEAGKEDVEPIAGEWYSATPNPDGGSTERWLTLRDGGTGERRLVATGPRAGTLVSSVEWRRAEDYELLLYCESVNGSTQSCEAIPRLDMTCKLDASGADLACVTDGDIVSYARQ
jgi:hypothetical protein